MEGRLHSYTGAGKVRIWFRLPCIPNLSYIRSSFPEDEIEDPWLYCFVFFCIYLLILPGEIIHHGWIRIS